MKTVNIVAAVFGFMCGLGVVIAYASMATFVFGDLFSFSLGGGFVFSTLLVIVGGIGTFVSGILQLVKQTQANNLRGLMIAAGILNILGGVFFIGPIFSVICAVKSN